MTPIVWQLGDWGRAPGLESALAAAGIRIERGHASALSDLVRSAYDGRGLLLLDAADEAARGVLRARDAELLPVLALATAEEMLPAGVLRLEPGPDPSVLAHHVLDVLKEPVNLRRHPRVPVRLAARVDGRAAWTRDVSLYGLRLESDGVTERARKVAIAIGLEDGAQVRLDGEVVSSRVDGVAIRCRPASDEDLVLWIHLILGGLETSPLHADADPFGPLFAQ